MTQLAEELRCFLVAFDPRHLANPSAANAELTSHGDGLPGVIKRMLTSLDKKPLEDFQSRLRRMSKFVQGVATLTVDQQEELWFSTGGGKGFPAREASAGLVLLAGYLAVRYGIAERKLLIEEPDNGVHPSAALAIVDILRELVEDGGQVLATTHNPLIVNHLEPEQVRIVTRDATTGVRVTPMTATKQFAERIQDFSLGELWYNVGEEALVSGA